MPSSAAVLLTSCQLGLHNQTSLGLLAFSNRYRWIPWKEKLLLVIGMLFTIVGILLVMWGVSLIFRLLRQCRFRLLGAMMTITDTN